jgi:predicted Zn-dependent peptidase
VVFEEIRLRHDDPVERATREFLALAFQASGLPRDSLGTIESVEAIPVEAILAYRDRHYLAANMAVAAAGNLRHDDAVARIAAAFAHLPQGSRHTRPRVAEPPQAEPRWLEIGAGTRVAQLRLGWPAPGQDHPDWPALFVLQDILGPTGRWLAEGLRTRGMPVTVLDPIYLRYSDAGTLMLRATAPPARAPAVVEALLGEVQRVRDGAVSDDDVQASLRAVLGRRALREESNDSQTVRAIGEVADVLDSYAEFVARLRAVRPTDVQRVAQHYLDPANYTLVVVRP